MKKAFVMVALDNLPQLLGERQFDLVSLLKTLPGYSPELRALEQRGYIVPDARRESGYGIQAEGMLWWLADELLRALRQQDELGAWLRAEGWDGLLKRGEKDALLRAAKGVGTLLKNGAEMLVTAAAADMRRARGRGGSRLRPSALGLRMGSSVKGSLSARKIRPYTDRPRRGGSHLQAKRPGPENGFVRQGLSAST